MDPWEQHRDVLRTLYSSKDRKLGMLRSIMAHMEAKHGFVRSKGQYERQFKKWGFRKNSTSEDWKTIHGKIQKRQNQGKKSAVYKSGKHVRAEKLNKERRHNFRKVEDLFNSHRSSGTVCCVESFCRHAMEELPQTPEGFTVCTPMCETVPPLLINNLPSLQLFGQLRSSVSDRVKAFQNPSQRNINELTGNNEAAYVRMGSPSISGKQVVAPVNTEVTAHAVTPLEETRDNDNNLDLTRFNDEMPDGESLQDLFRVSRTGELSSLVLPMLHRASNNLLSWHEANSLVNLIIQGNDRQVFNAVISTRSPATQAIARTLLPAAIVSPDLELFRSLLDTGINLNLPVVNAFQTPLQFAAAEGKLYTGSLELIQLLLDYGAEVNLPWTKYTSSPLVYAAKGGHLGLVQLLLAAGADVNAHVSTGETTALQAVSGAWVSSSPTKQAAAVEGDRLEIAQLLLNAGADVNAHPQGHWGETALQAAVRQENNALVQILLSHGADPNAAASLVWEETALQAAASAGNLGIIDLLLTWGALDVLAATESALQTGHMQAAQSLLSFGMGVDVIDNDTYKTMALRMGIRSGDYHFVQSLLESNVDLDARMNTQQYGRATVLQEAAMNGDVNLVRLLISFGADVNAAAEGEHGGTALQFAAREGHVELVQLLLGAGADVNSDSPRFGMMALQAAVSWGEIEIVQLLLDSGADMSVQGAAAVMETTIAGYEPDKYLKIRQLLLDHFPSSGVDCPEGAYESDEDYFIDCELMSLLVQHGVVDDGFALRYAIMQRDLGLVKLTLHLGANVNAGQEYEDEVWILERAVSEGAGVELLQLLLEHGANAQQIARALQTAAYLGHLEHVEVLIRAKGDVNADPLHFLDEYTGQQSRTALQAAAQRGHLEVVRLLLEEGAEVERSSISEYEEGTALQFAAISGSIAIANELIQRGAIVNAAPLGADGRTALEGAAEHGRLDMVQLLLNLEAEVRGSRALQFARKEGHDGVVMLLLQNGFEDDIRVSG